MDKVKMNLVDKFTAVKAMLNGETVENFSVADAMEFLDTRIGQTQRKNAGGNGERKLTKTQIENEGIKEQIVAFLREQTEPISATEVGKGVGISQNKATSLMGTLLTEHKGEPNPNGCVKRIVVKGKALFSIA